MKVTFKTGSEANYGSTIGEMFFASDTKQLLLNGVKYIPKKLSELTNDSGFLTSITKSMVENVLTGNITSHTHSYAGSSSAGGVATSANSLTNQGMLDTQEQIDGFLTANKLGYAIFKTTDSNNVGFGSNDGMLLSLPWNNNSYGAQIAFDDTTAGTVKVRGKSISWGSWHTLLHSGNYTTYAATKDHTHTFSSITSKPTTLGGYGITDAALATDLSKYLPLTGGTLTGNLTCNGSYIFMNGGRGAKGYRGYFNNSQSADRAAGSHIFQSSGWAYGENATSLGASAYAGIRNTDSDSNDYPYLHWQWMDCLQVKETTSGTAVNCYGAILTNAGGVKDTATFSLCIDDMCVDYGMANNSEELNNFLSFTNTNASYGRVVVYIADNKSGDTNERIFGGTTSRPRSQSNVKIGNVLLAQGCNITDVVSMSINGVTVYRVAFYFWSKTLSASYDITQKTTAMVCTKVNDTNYSAASSYASGNFSVASGYYSVASGYYSVASGYSSVASGYYSVASGASSVASGAYSVASGYYSVASGASSVASGYSSVASGASSVASGYSSVASGYYSVAMNYKTIAGTYQLAIGRRNASVDAPFVIGNGSGDNVSDANAIRQNCFVVDWNGNATFGVGGAGTVTAANFNGNLSGYSEKKLLKFDYGVAIGSNAPFSAATSWATKANLNDCAKLYYNYQGVEASLLFSMRPDSYRYGTILKWGYADKYIYMARKNADNWISSDWEKISAGYADTANTANTANTLSGVSLNQIVYRTIYPNMPTGILIETDIAVSTNKMVNLHIWGNSYAKTTPIDTYIQFYYKNNGEIVNCGCTHLGYNFGDVYVFIYNSLVHIWVDVSGTYYPTINAFVGTNEGGDISGTYNHITSITKDAKPTSGITREVIITPKVNAFTDSNVATATKLQTPITIKVGSTSRSFDGSADISFDLSDIMANSSSLALNVGSITTQSSATIREGLTVNGDISGELANKLNITLGTSSAITFDNKSTLNVTISPSTIGAAAASHTHTFSDLSGVAAASHTHLYAGSTSVGGSATSAVKLNTSRKLWGQSFDGTTDIDGSIILSTSEVSVSISRGIRDTSTSGFIGFRYSSKGDEDKFSGICLGWASNPTSADASLRINASTFAYKGNTVWHGGNLKLRYTSSGLSRAVQKDSGNNLYVVAPSLFEQGISNNYPKNLRWITTDEGQLAYDTEETAGVPSTVQVSIPVANGTSKGFMKSISTVTDVTGYTPCPVKSGTPYYKLDAIELDYTDFFEIGSGSIEDNLSITNPWITPIPNGGSLEYLLNYGVNNIPRLLTIDLGGYWKYFFWLQQTDDESSIVAYYHCQFNDLWIVIDSPNREIRISQGGF